VFLHPVGSAGHIVYASASTVRNIDALLFMLGWDRYGLHKKYTGTRYTEIVFLHPVGGAGHVVHSVRPSRETTEHYFSYSGGTGTDSIKS
jgi:hypothetical protein